MELPPLRPSSIVPTQRVGPGEQERQAGGRLFAAEVVQTAAGGSLVLAVGRDRIAATSLAAMQVGQKLLVRLRGSGAAQTLEILSPSVEAEPATGASPSSAARPHVFGLLAQGKGVGELLADLSQALRTGAGSSGAAPARQALESFAFTPGGSGAQLAAHVSRSGLGHEARALGSALQRLPHAVLAAAVEELVASAFRALDPAAAPAARQALGRELAQALSEPSALARLLGLPAGSLPQAGSVLSTQLAPALARRLRAGPPTAQRAQVADLLQLSRLSPRFAQALLEALLGERAALARELLAPASTESQGPVLDDIDFKAWLTTLANAAEAGPERAAARAAIEALEAEQLLALARSNLGEGTHLCFALREAGGFVDARLVHRRAAERDSQAGGEADSGAERAVLGLEFSRTGPVRAEFVIDPQSLCVRLSVSSAQVAAQMNSRLAELQAQLETLGRGVRLQLAVCPRESLRVPGPEDDALLAEGGRAVDVVG